jgi:hypothetical protein
MPKLIVVKIGVKKPSGCCLPSYLKGEVVFMQNISSLLLLTAISTTIRGKHNGSTK